MPANTNVHTPLLPLLDSTDTTPIMQALPEDATQSFLIGVPVQVNTGGNVGYMAKWNGTTFTAGIAGVSATFGLNLATPGKGAPAPFGQIGPIGAIQNWGNVLNEASAVNIAIGTPIADGRTLFHVANETTIFEGMIDNNAGTVPANYTPTQANVGQFYGITFDAGGTCYVDLGKSTVGTNTCVQIISLSPVDGSIVNARVRFKFAKNSLQLAG